ncbi:hypothetical protein EHQ53_00280 [Leptospira langatensis]|uniref:Alpha/beta hydrolase n=1 Tax=Leptospira langatensis TaxID=2484983 RepID=A0A5F1ZW90_9LEPT|nr:hypothetical protein [Leptospira langatensis]TGJ98208.1 hypothetical protein EHO57_16425 [Leptospira langatensis]TGL43122.1 hypothetical protein EHQ53_00280 [Leptospira langatensis]
MRSILFTSNIPTVFLFSLLLSALVACRADGKLTAPEIPPGYKKVSCNISAYRVSNLCEDEKAYLDWATSAYPEMNALSSLTEANLLKISEETEDIDKGAALFYQRVITDPKNKRFLEYLDKKEADFKQQRPDFSGKKTVLAMVPGMFYADNPEVGADGAALRKLASNVGIRSDLIPVGQASPASENAKTICEYLEFLSPDETVIIASPSKGSADFRTAIETCGKEPYFKKVRGWYSIGGILKGSRMIEGVLDDFWTRLEVRTYFFFKGYDWSGFLSIRKGKDAPLDKDWELPSGIQMINVVGVPLFRHVSLRARPYYNFLMNYGPNDGIILLSDALHHGSLVYPSFRNDHYFLRGMPEAKILAMIAYLLEADPVK